MLRKMPAEESSNRHLSLLSTAKEQKNHSVILDEAFPSRVLGSLQ